jgi:hypothetical protein
MQLSKANTINWFFGVNKVNESYLMPNTAAQVLHFIDTEQVLAILFYFSLFLAF